jgi:hypothetical protein
MPAEEMGSRALPQPPDINNRATVMIIAGYLLFVAVAIAGMLLFLKIQAPGAFTPGTKRPFPAPELQRAPEKDLRRYQAAQRAILHNYAWVDREHDIARIPIDEAMRLVIGRGQHAYDALQAPHPLVPGASGDDR